MPARKLFPVCLLSALALPAWAQELWVNEFHYDNSGADAGEFVEIVVSDSVATAPGDIELVLYNGSNGTSYATEALDTFSAAAVAGFTIYTKAISGIQNGAPDGMALVEAGSVVQFLSYEGTFPASGGPADGLTSTDIGVEEAGGTAIGESLQLSGTGSTAADFTWQPPAVATPGAINSGQMLQPAAVTATDPADGATNVAVTSTLTVDFDQAIDALEGAASLNCGGNQIALSGLPAADTMQLVLTPEAELPAAAGCEATLTASLIENQDGIALGSDFSWTFQTEIGVVEIFQIQGSGAASPFADQVVTTEANVVTAVGPNGFFMQTPDARADGDIDTADGIFVFTGAAPAVQAGDQVDVSGEVIEFFDFTEFSNGPTVVATGTAPLPAPVTFDATTPSRDPDAPSCAIEFECYEGMRIDLPGAVVGQGNQSFGSEPFAEVSIRAGSRRAFRGPGVAFPGLAGGIPVWDGNPETFELSPAALGLPELALFGGTRIAAEGVLGFSFGDYELWPTRLDILEAPAVPEAAPQAEPGQFTIGSINLLRLFNATDDSGSDDFVEDPAVYAERLQRFAGHIVEQMRAPAIVGVQEIENIETLQDLAGEIAGFDATLDYSARLVEGNDVGGIDVGYLVRDDVTIQRVEQLGAGEILGIDDSLLHDRPPLLLEASVADGAEVLEFNLLLVHNRSLGGIETERVKTKRLAQAQSIGQMVQGLQTGEPDQPTIVLGDFNAFEFSDGFVDVVGQIAGTAADAENEFWAAPLTSPVLKISTLGLPADERYSFVFRGNAQALDHALFSQAAVPHVISTDYTRGNSDAPDEFVDNPPAGDEDLGMSDHDSLVVTLSVIAELLFADGFEATP